jgi:hypothetical protein
MKTAIPKYDLYSSSTGVIAIPEKSIVEIVGETPNLYLIKYKNKVAHYSKKHFILNSIVEKREGIMLRQITGTAFGIIFVRMGERVEIVCEIPDGRFLIKYNSTEYLVSQSAVDEIKPDYDALSKFLEWGTYGKSGKEPLKWVRLIDCSTEHLKAILNTQKQISGEYRETIQFILKERE